MGKHPPSAKIERDEMTMKANNTIEEAGCSFNICL